MFNTYMFDTYMRDCRFAEAKNKSDKGSEAYYIATFYEVFFSSDKHTGILLKEHLLNLLETLKEYRDESQVLDTAKKLLKDITTPDDCYYEYFVWRKSDTDMLSFTWDEPEDGASLTPVQSASVAVGADAKPAYNFSDLDLLFKYAETGILTNIAFHLRKHTDGWVLALDYLCDYAEYITPQLCWHPDCHNIYIKAREHRCPVCGTYRVIHHQDAKMAKTLAEANKDPTETINKQKKDIIRTYLPLQIAFGALALYLFGGVIKAFL